MNTWLNSSPLAACRVSRVTAPWAVQALRFRQPGDGILVGDEGQILQEFGQALFLEVERQAAQLLHVIPAVVAFFGLVIDVAFVTGILDDAVKQRGQRDLVFQRLPFSQQGAKICQQRCRTGQSAASKAEASAVFAQGRAAPRPR